MSASVLSIANRSLLSVGARAQVADLQEGSAEANAISVLFAPTFEHLARSARWNCLRKQASLSLLAAATGTPENPDGTTLPQPPVPWLYQYSYPSDCLALRNIVPALPVSSTGVPISPAYISGQTILPGGGQIPFAVAYATDAQSNPITVILCNQTQAQAVYTVNQPNPQIWDSMFQAAMVASLAAYLVPALSLNLPLMSMSIKTAESIITQARVADGNEGVTSVNRNAQWMTARTCGTGPYDGYGGYGMYGGQQDMSWPAC